MKVWKVVQRDGEGRFWSATKSCLALQLQTEYKPGIAVRAPVGRCFAFDNEQSAHNFADRKLCEVHEAQCGDAVAPSGRIPAMLGMLEEIHNWWRGQWNRIRGGTQQPPAGTVLCDFIILGPKV